MRKLLLIVFLGMLCLGLGLALSCATGDDDDSGGGDDDAGDDDDSGGGDDDNAAGDTWMDSSSGLTWQVSPSSDSMTWDEAKTYCDSLTLGGLACPALPCMRRAASPWRPGSSRRSVCRDGEKACSILAWSSHIIA